MAATALGLKKWMKQLDDFTITGLVRSCSTLVFQHCGGQLGLKMHHKSDNRASGWSIKPFTNCTFVRR